MVKEDIVKKVVPEINSLMTGSVSYFAATLTLYFRVRAFAFS